MTYDERYNQYKIQIKMHEQFRSETPESMLKNDREIFIDFRNNPEGELIFKIKNMKERSQEVKRRVKPLDDDNLNVLMIFIDTLSRNNFHRKYRHTKKVLEKYNFKNKASSRLYEFFRLHSIKSYTFPNLAASSYGIEASDLSQHRKRINRYAEEQGYITAFGADFCAYCEAEVSKSKPKKFRKNEKNEFFAFLTGFELFCDSNTV